MGIEQTINDFFMCADKVIEKQDSDLINSLLDIVGYMDNYNDNLRVLYQFFKKDGSVKYPARCQLEAFIDARIMDVNSFVSKVKEKYKLGIAVKTESGEKIDFWVKRVEKREKELNLK